MFQNKLGGYYGKEDLQTEFKELCLQISLDLYISEAEAEEILEKKIWNSKLQFAIDDSLNIYLTSIIPKYILSFSGSNINGELYIGIDDYGEITGIPYYGDLQKSTILNIIYSTIKEKIQSCEDICKYIDIEVIKLDVNQLLITDEYSDSYKKYKSEIINRNNIMIDYQNKKMSWLMELAKYTRKLTEIINSNEGRIEMIPYVKSHSEEFEDREDFLKIISILEGTEYISIPKYEELIVRKKKKNDILYWLVTFKDYNTARVSSQRPAKPCFSRIFSPFQIISKLSLIRNILTNIEEINYYLIKIIIKGGKIDNISLKGSERLLTRLVDKKGQPYTN